ncbi:MAG TPA: Gfo/Idh/MocA family oxidoreductase [Burkholderiaceae bacterium]|nr:Gfo/Idh/MocA family oxidoreductase [Burkholderiaceae bacterium]
MREIGVGVIGTGFMGKSHAFAYRAVGGAFPECIRPRLVAIADADADVARRAADQYGFARGTADWRTLVADPAIGIVSITTPNALHKEMALAAIAAGKHVHCEKPLAPGVADAKLLTEAAESAGIRTQVGFNYIKNPLLNLAREMIAAGEIGDVTGFRGLHAEDYMADPEVPYTWRLDPRGGAGVIADLGSHIIGIARFLVGPIDEVFADLETAIGSRPAAPGATERRAVEVDDVARMLVRFRRGCRGSIEASWIASGRKMQLAFEVTGSRGSIAFTQERFNELQLYRAGSDPRQAGFVRIEAGPQHAPYGNFCVAAGHQLGFNDMKTIEVADFLKVIAGERLQVADFREAWEIQKVVDAAIRSSGERRWLTIA